MKKYTARRYTGWIPRFDESINHSSPPNSGSSVVKPGASGALRRCLVDDKPCLFHRWIDVDKTILNLGVFTSQDNTQKLVRNFHEFGIVGPGCKLETLRETLALVEYPDGSVGKVSPSLVTFWTRR